VVPQPGGATGRTRPDRSEPASRPRPGRRGRRADTSLGDARRSIRRLRYVPGVDRPRDPRGRPRTRRERMTMTEVGDSVRHVHSVLGESVSTPVAIRSARASSALFAVHSRPARRILAEVGLEPVVPLPGRALCSLAFVRYVDGDLGPYHEFAVSLLCRGSGGSRTPGAYFHWLPVNQRFTCAAGRAIWGFPKEVTDIDLDMAGPGTHGTVRVAGRHAITLHTDRGAPVPATFGAASVDAYTARDGVLRRTPWRMHPTGVRMRPGGARVELGDHPVAEELRELGLPGTALSTSHVNTLRMSFEDAEEVA